MSKMTSDTLDTLQRTSHIIRPGEGKLINLFDQYQEAWRWILTSLKCHLRQRVEIKAQAIDARILDTIEEGSVLIYTIQDKLTI